MRIRLASDPKTISSFASSSAAGCPLSQLVHATAGTMEVSGLAKSVLDALSPWSHANPLLGKFLDAYDSGDTKKASRICSSTVGPKAGGEHVVNLVYRCVRGDVE